MAGLRISCVEGMVSVRNSCEGVDLEVLVGADLGDGLDGAPVSEGGLSIVEPFVGHVLKVVGINVGDTLGNLRAGNAAVQVEHLRSNLL